MEHLVYMHDAEIYRIDSSSKEEILKPCDVCGKKDSIYLSWEDGQREEVLDKFLVGDDKSAPNVAKALKEGQTKDDLILGTRIYFGLTREIINSLYKTGSINREKQLELTKQNRIKEKKQLKQINKDSCKIKMRRLLNNN